MVTAADLAHHVRLMHSEERWAWDRALRVARTEWDADVALDTLCEAANNAEERSIRAEERGQHLSAIGWWRASELFDVAAKVLL